jgi:ABC-type branched-subunit amino acid transport system ATPase component
MAGSAASAARQKNSSASTTERHRAEVAAIIAFLEIDRYCGKLIETLPFRIQKDVGIARVPISKPRLLLLSEPSAELAREERGDLAHPILKTKQELDILVCWIDHDMQMVGDFADQNHRDRRGRKIAVALGNCTLP